MKKVKKIKSLEDLNAIRDTTAPGLNPQDDSVRVVVGLATCGVAAGAQNVFQALHEKVAEEGLEQSFILIIQLSALSETEFVDILRQAEPPIHAVQIIGNPAENHIALNHLSPAHGNAFRGKQFLAFGQGERTELETNANPVVEAAAIAVDLSDNP